MQKILLINPEESRTIWTLSGIIDDEPLDIEMIYTVLKEEKYNVKIHDIQRDPEKIENVIKNYKPNIIFINGVVKQVPFMLEYITLAKKINKKIVTILGGNYAEYNYKRLYCEDLDYVSRTYDPYVILDIVKYHDMKNINLKNLNGLCYKKDNQWMENKIKPIDIQTLPIINRTFFNEHKMQFRYMDIKPIAHIRTAYSCPYKCKFCYRTMLNSRKYSCRNIEDIIYEIKTIDCENIYFIDDDFLFDRKRLEFFIKLIKKEKIKKNYVCYGRVDFIVNNKDIMRALKEIGLTYVIVGLEATNNSYLDKYNKKIKTNESEKCIQFLDEIGIRCMGLLIVDIDFTAKDFKNMYKWIKQSGLKYLGYSIYTPLPGSDLEKEFKDKYIENDLTKFDYIHTVVKPTRMSVKHFYYCYYQLIIKSFLLVKKYGTYDYIDINGWIKEFFKLNFKGINMTQFFLNFWNEFKKIFCYNTGIRKVLEKHVKCWKKYSILTDISIDEIKKIIIENNIQLILIDMDGTLKHYKKGLLPENKKWIMEVKKYTTIYIISNANKSLTSNIADELGLKYYHHAKKPLPFCFKKILKKEGISSKNTIMIGDAIVADMFGAKLSKIRKNILLDDINIKYKD